MFNTVISYLKNKTFLAFVFIFTLSFTPRFIMLFTRRLLSFGVEQGMDLLFVKDIVINHAIYLIGYNTNYVWHIPKGSGWYYLLSLPFILGNGDPFWAKAMTGVVSVATVILSFFILRSGFGLKVAVTTGILLSISPWLIEQTGQIWPPYIVIFPVALFLYGVLKVLEKKQKYAILIAIAIGLMMQFEIAIAYFYIIQMLILGLLAIKYKYLSTKIFVLSFLTLLLFFVPNIIYDLTHNFYSTNGFSILIKQFTNNGFGSLLNLLGQRVDAFTWNFRSTFSANIVKSICLLLIMCLGTYLFIKDRKIANYQKLFLAYLVLTPITRILFLFFYPDSIRAWYLLDLVIIYCFTLGIVLGYFLKKKRLMIFSLAIIAGLMLIFMARTNELFRNEFSLSLGIGRIAQSVVVEYVFKDANRQPFNYIPLDIQKRFDFDYLFWWYGTKKYNFKPSTVQQKIRYYIFDKNDPNEERFPKDFTGNVTDTIVFPNGFIVKKVIN